MIHYFKMLWVILPLGLLIDVILLILILSWLNKSVHIIVLLTIVVHSAVRSYSLLLVQAGWRLLTLHTIHFIESPLILIIVVLILYLWRELSLVIAHISLIVIIVEAVIVILLLHVLGVVDILLVHLLHILISTTMIRIKGDSMKWMVCRVSNLQPAWTSSRE
jgi:hypothetical protein